MIKITMFSSADKVAGQGVGSAYLELVNLLRNQCSDNFEIEINHYNKSQISHYHTIDPLFYLSTFSKKRGRKIGYVHFLPETLEGSLKIPQPFRGLFYHYVIAFYKRMDQLVVVNPSFIKKLVAYGIPESKIAYIPNFVDSDRFHCVSPTTKKSLRKKYNVDAQRFVVLGSGQVQERKGVPDFIRLAKQNPDVDFIWAGGFSFGRLTDGYHELKKVVDNPPANLRFTGIVSRDEIAELNNLADLFLLPSYNELFPMSVLEAFSCGTPVMLRDLDLYHYIIDGDYEPASDVNEMQTKLELLQKDPARLAYLQKRAQIAAREYSKEHLANVWTDFYKEQARKGGA
ncbi:glycosyltransferase family 4 protein [Limosilactobacillus sp. STM2_1]|uniref:Glycosyltransferase family 4 protein n=1 Tax=Limosilactobacillus rudii TaxID=2759755 RepID=A0A7W3YN88_9LACO|nr:glycosyltransferase family 4 protein [Limosilactobacillus rudii]MBB1079815.1 glycosyltransferase family 4 protein [Limosilactobacillus rudii]MBB1097893.1 glycosyltransferase family 4 protein [Limosilactobacillus rudii]MCD7134975.1 glycosyltransferase family 4 protein [Limosilactobacillus rudii]